MWGHKERSKRKRKRKKKRRDGVDGEKRRKGVRALASEIVYFSERVMVMEFAKDTDEWIS